MSAREQYIIRKVGIAERVGSFRSRRLVVGTHEPVKCKVA